MSKAKKKKGKNLNDLRSQLDRLGYRSDGNQIRPKQGGAWAKDVRRTMHRRKATAAGGAEPAKSESSSAGGALIYRRKVPYGGKKQKPTLPVGPPVELESAVPGEVLSVGPRGALYQVSTCVAETENGGMVDRAFREALGDPASVLRGRLQRAGVEDAASLDDLVFMDIETTGLGSSPLFLIGVMLWTGNGFEVRQLLARTYAEERPVVEAFHELCEGRGLLVTFNGKSFDMPYIRARAAATGVRFTADPFHFDLLHESRRSWKDEFPDCRLQTLEQRVCGREERTGDIPGGDIPDAYHDYVRTGNAALIVNVLRHNARDLITLAEIMSHLPELPEK